MSSITILEGQKTSKKVYTDEGKSKVESSYLHDSTEYDVNNLNELYGVIRSAAKNPNNVIIRGSCGVKHNFNVRRSTDIFYEVDTNWICIDFDSLETPHVRTSIEAVEYLITTYLPSEFHNVSYVLQWSSSAGILRNGKPVKAGTNCHLFFYHDRGLVKDEYDVWLDKNINKIDPAVFRIVQPIFIHPIAELRGTTLVDTIPSENKIQLIKHDTDIVRVPVINVTSVGARKTSKRFKAADLTDEQLNKLEPLLVQLSPYIHSIQAHTVNLWSNKETTPGGYFLYLSNPTVVIKASDYGIRWDLKDWVKEFWNASLNVDYPVIDTFTSAIKKYKDKVNVVEYETKQDERYWNTDEFNECYVPKDILTYQEGKIVLIKSPKGTGKTEVMVDFVNQCKQQNKSVLLVGHRVKLLEMMAKRLGLKFYQELDDKSKNIKYIAICINSLLHLTKYNFMGNYDVVIIDESEQVFQHFVGSTVKGFERQQITKSFHSRLKKSKMVVCADADMTDLTGKIISDVCLDKDVHLHVNNWLPGEGKTITTYDDESTLVKDLINEAKQGKTIYFSSNSKNRIDRLYDELNTLNFKCYKITSDNSANPASVNLLNHLNLKSFKCPYQVVLVSPSVSTGVDIQTPFDIVYGYFMSKVTSHFDMDQQVCRVRNAGAIKVYVEKKTFKTLQTSYQIIRDEYVYNLKANKHKLREFINESEIDELVGSDWWEWLLTVASLVKSHENSSFRDSRNNYYQLKEAQGYTVVELAEMKDDLYSIKGSNFNLEEYTLGILRANKLTDAEVQELKLRTSTDDEKYMLERYFMEKFFCVDVNDSPDVIELYASGYRKLQRAYEIVVSDKDDLESKDVDQMKKVHIIDAGSFTRKQELLLEGLTVLGAINIVNGEIQIVEEFKFSQRSQNTADFIEWCKTVSQVSQKLIGVVLSGSMINHQPSQVIRDFLLKAGFKTIQVGKYWDGQNTKKEFGFDLEHIKLLNRFFQLRKGFIRQFKHDNPELFGHG